MVSRKTAVPAGNDDQVLLECAVAGDESALAALSDGYRDRLADSGCRHWAADRSARAVILYEPVFPSDPFAH
jgi:hypothetical protein